MSVKIDDIINILKGIDKTETEDSEGWWETSTGAEFGKNILEKINALFDSKEIK